MAVDALDVRPDHVQRVAVEEQVRQPAMQEHRRQQAVDFLVLDDELVDLGSLNEQPVFGAADPEAFDDHRLQRQDLPQQVDPDDDCQQNVGGDGSRARPLDGDHARTRRAGGNL